jgi:uncharacterized protein (UPF0332 family)
MRAVCMGADESDDVDVSAALQEAHTLLADVRSFKEIDVSDDTAVNRLYYACYHATKAVLYDRGYNPKTHDGVKSLLGKELVLSGDVTRADGKFFREIQDHRDRADYEYHSVPADVDVLLERGEEYVETMEQLLSNAEGDGETDE